MKNFFEIDGNVSLREARMTHITLRPGAENAPAPEQPQGEQRFDMRADQLPEETLRALNYHISRLQNQANDTVESELQRIVSTAQRDVDALAATPGASKQFVTDYIRASNEGLHQRKLHMSMINGQVRISPHNPTQFPPEVIARKNKINELQGKINQVDRNIRELMQSFRQNAVQYRGQKFAAMNRGNIAPEINQMLMQFPQASMQASAGPLNQLYALKFQLQQELAGVKSGMIKVAVPTQGDVQDPSLINDPRYAASGMGDTRFNLGGAPGGIGPDGLPLPNAMPSAAEQAAILRLAARWRSVDTEEERDTVEGFLMMDGVDVDSSNLDKDEIVMVSPEEKGMMFLMGLITVLKSFLDRLNRKKTEIEESTVTDKDPATMKVEEITAEKEGNDKKIDELKVKKRKNETDIKDAEKKLKNVEKPLEGDAKTKVETELKQMKEELKKINEEIEKLEKRNTVLANPETFKESEKDITTQDQMKDDPVLQEFRSAMEKAKQQMRTSLQQALGSGDFQKNIERLGAVLGIDMTKVDWQAKTKDALTHINTWLDKFMDNTKLEKNSSGKYRIAVDIIGTLNELKQIEMFKDIDVKANDLQKFISMAKSRGLAFFESEGRAVTSFVDAEEIRRSL